MKDWQKGFDLEYLLLLEEEYLGSNTKIRSPFAQFKKHHIADALSKKQFKILRHQLFYNITCTFTRKVVKAASNIIMHGDTVIGRKEAGDVVIENVAGDLQLFFKELQMDQTNNIWVIVPAWSYKLREVIENAKFTRIGVKINTFSDMYAVYFRNALGKMRQHPHVSEIDTKGKKLLFTFDKNHMENLVNKRMDLVKGWMNHYSNYNKDNAWSAVSLRGYSPDPLFIEKPVEMSDTWKEEHKDQEFGIQDTELMLHFPYVNALVKELNTEIHRVRFMKLAPGGGELERHTDQVDPDTGTAVGKLIRLHYPIKTNPECIFTTWNWWDQEMNYHFGLGECWYLDTRKPHKAVNNGAEERIHLVVDAIVTPSLQELLEREDE